MLGKDLEDFVSRFRSWALPSRVWEIEVGGGGGGEGWGGGVVVWVGAGAGTFVGTLIGERGLHLLLFLFLLLEEEEMVEEMVEGSLRFFVGRG